jgi:hypothetical protein
MSSSEENNNDGKWKVVGCRVTEDELKNIITPVKQDCYNLGLIKHDTLSSFVKFCINFWIGHYYNKKREFAMRAQEIENEKKKLAEIAAERQAWEKSPAVIKQQDRLKNLENSSTGT